MVSVKILLDLLAYGAALLGMIPLYPHLDRPVQAFLPVALLAGVYCDRLGRHPLRGWPVTVLSLLLFSAYALQISAEHVVQPVVHMLLVLLAIRLVAAKEGRHYLQIFVLAVFALVGATLLSLSPLFLPALLLLVSCLTAGLVLLTFYQAEPQLRFNGRQLRQVLTATLLLALLSLPLVLLFFLILPRTQHPVWDFLNPQPASIAFADEVRPGSLVGLAKSGAVAFRAEMEELPAGDLYWRGTVLNTAEGDVWQRRVPPPGGRERVVGGRPMRQVIYPERETGLGTYLFALDLPQSLAGIAAAQAADLVHTGGRPLDRRAPYQAISHFAGHLQAESVDRDFYLQLPASAAPRLAAEAERIAAQGGSERQKIARLEAFFRHQQLTYATTDLPGPE
ncbi:MAG: DUF3488 domain-containing protein, partial [Desulfuromonadales bacterium]|nr:DUF3488 domain-containing protein [Desulfuromonadales bacterium]